MAVDSTWTAFCADCIEAMDRFQQNEIALHQIDDYLAKYEDSELDKELLEFIWNTISEIDAVPEDYAELLTMLKAGTSEAALVEFMNRPLNATSPR